MKPRLLNLAAGISLLLAGVILFLWVRSHEQLDQFSRSWFTATQEHVQLVQSWSSQLSFSTGYISGTFHPIDPTYKHLEWTFRAGTPLPLLRWFPFPPAGLTHTIGAGYDQSVIVMTYWLLLLPTLPLPLLAAARLRRRRHRETNNLCPTCGYDLRATPEKSGMLFDRCPECGTSALIALEEPKATQTIL